MTKIVIFDDEQADRTSWKERLSALPSITERFDVRYAAEDEFLDGIAALEKRRVLAREHPDEVDWGQDNVFDTASVLIVDYDLLCLDANGESGSSFLTGEAVSYLARCYSRCGFIIALNQYGNTFDLTLRGHPDSFADLNIASDQLDNRSLWETGHRGFRPWYWRLVPAALDRFEVCASALAQDVKRPLLDCLRFPAEVVPLLPRTVTQFVEGALCFEETTVVDFVTESTQGLRGKDQPLNGEAIARIGAARLQKWIERIIMPGQEIIVDAPHLAGRMPSLLTSSGDLSIWNQTAVFGVNVVFGSAESHRWQADEWISRPVWWWQTLRDEQRIAEVTAPWSIPRAPFVFCEDVSEFASPAQATEFVADVDSPFVRRFVVGEGSELAMQLGVSRQDVEYRPAVRFAM